MKNSLGLRATAVVAMAAALQSCTTTASTPGRLPIGMTVGDQMLSPFYQWTGALPQEPGVMLRVEPMTSQAEFTAAALMQRILYTSMDARWKSGALPVSGTFYMPKGQAPAGGWPIVAWAHGTLGVSDSCAPSWSLHRPRDATYLNRWLQAGFAVVATDYQGLGGPGPHPYLIWEAEGRSVLDAVRAVLAAHPHQLRNDLVITGQSQGSGASIGASRILKEYAPELNLRATIATGVVSSFPEGPYKLPDVVSGRGAPARFNVLRLLGGSLPDAGPTADSIISERGRPLLQKGREACVDEMRGIEQAQSLDMASAFNIEPAALNRVLTPVTDMTPVQLPAPTFLGTGLADRTVPPQRQYAAVAALCAAGSQIVWKAYPGVTHNGIVNAAFDDEMAFVRGVAEKSSVTTYCAGLMDPGPPTAATPGIRFND